MAAISFDAGEIAARLTVSKDQFSRDLKQAKADAEKFAKDPYKAKLEADPRPAILDIDKAQAKADKFGHTTSTATLKVNTKTAESDIDRTSKKFETLGSKISKGLGGVPLLATGIVAALPPAISLLGVATGAAAALGGAFTAGGGALAAYGLTAKGVLGQASTAAKAVEKAQTAYNAAIEAGTKKATAYKAEQLAIAKAYAGMSPAQVALSKQIGDLSQKWDDLRKSVTPVIALSVKPWLGAITDSMHFLQPVIKDVSTVVGGLGYSFRALVNSGEFRTFAKFIAGEGSQVVGAAGGGVLNFLNGFIILLPQFKPLIDDVDRGISEMGRSFLSWAQSDRSRTEVQQFLAWLHINGPVVGQFLANFGKALVNIGGGLGAGGITELKVLSDFFGLLARLPKSIVAPVTDVAASLLLISKFSTGRKIISVAINWAGQGAAALLKLLTGGKIDLGSKFGAATGMQKAADTMVEASAAMQRAADTMAGAGAEGGAAGTAGAAGGGEAAAGGAAGATGLRGLLARAGLSPGILSPIGWGIALGAVIKAAGDHLAPAGTGAGRLSGALQQSGSPLLGSSNAMPQIFGGFESKAILFKPFQDFVMSVTTFFAKTLPHLNDSAAAGLAKGWATVNNGWLRYVQDPVENWLTQSLPHAASKGWSTLVGAVGDARHGVASQFDGMRHDVASAAADIRHTAASRFDDMRHDVASTVSSLRHGAASQFDGLRGDIASTLTGARHDAAAAWNAIWQNTVSRAVSGIHTLMGHIGVLPGDIKDTFSGAGHWLVSAGHNVISGLWSGMKDAWHAVAGWISKIGSVIKSLKGPIGVDSKLLVPEGKAIMHSLLSGLKIGGTSVLNWVSGLTGQIGGAVSSGAAVTLGKAMAAARGWTGANWTALNELWTRESGWRWNATNPTSGAYGIPQSLPAAKMASAGPDWRTNPATQIRWGLGYIAGRYGSPSGAWAHEQKYGWYARGSQGAAPGWAWVGEEGPELVRMHGGETVLPHAESLMHAMPGLPGYAAGTGKPPKAVHPRTGSGQYARDSKALQAAQDELAKLQKASTAHIAVLRRPISREELELLDHPGWPKSHRQAVEAQITKQEKVVKDYRDAQSKKEDGLTKKIALLKKLIASDVKPKGGTAPKIPTQSKKAMLARLAADVTKLGKLKKTVAAKLKSMRAPVNREELYLLQHPGLSAGKRASLKAEISKQEKTISAYRKKQTASEDTLESEIKLLRSLTGEPDDTKYGGAGTDTTAADDTSAADTSTAPTPAGTFTGVLPGPPAAYGGADISGGGSGGLGGTGSSGQLVSLPSAPGFVSPGGQGFGSNFATSSAGVGLPGTPVSGLPAVPGAGSTIGSGTEYYLSQIVSLLKTNPAETGGHLGRALNGVSRSAYARSAFSAR